MPLREIRSAKHAIDILGGVMHVAELCGVGRNAVSNWYSRRIPPEHHHLLGPLLHKAGYTFPPSLFRQTEFGKAATKPARLPLRRRKNGGKS